MSREKELAKNTIILAIGNFLPRLLSLITLPIITGYLTKAEYGTYDLVLSLVTLIIPVVTLQIKTAAFRFLIDQRGNIEKCRQIVTNIYVFTIPLSFISAVVISLFFIKASITTAILIGGYFLADVLYQTVCQVARGLAYNKIYAISSIISSCINAAGIVAFVKFANSGLNGVVVSLFIAYVIATIYISVRIKLHKYIRLNSINRDNFKELISYSWPMVPNGLSSWVLKLSDRFVIIAALGVEANAVYAVANKIPSLLSIVQTVFTMAWQENASMVVEDEEVETYYSKMFDTIFSLTIGVTALIIGFLPFINSILIKGDYDDAYVQMPILILAMFFYCMSAFQGGIYVAHKKSKSVGITTMIAAGINFLIDILLVNTIGIFAGSISTLVAYVFLYIYRTFDSLKFQRMDYKLKKQLVLFTIIIIMLAMCFLRNEIFNVLNAAISIVVFIVLNHDLMTATMNSLLKKK